MLAIILLTAIIIGDNFTYKIRELAVTQLNVFCLKSPDNFFSEIVNKNCRSGEFIIFFEAYTEKINVKGVCHCRG